MKSQPKANNEIYHIYNRGVDKRKIFLEDRDYLRFIHDLFEFNDQEPAIIKLNYHLHTSHQIQYSEVGLPNIERKPRKFMVEIMVFCLMPNHFHLMVRQLVDGGITEFMRKLGTGYTNYFNQKYERSGHLFQGKFKSVHIKNDSHFIHLPYYIHANPLDLIGSEWREKTLKNCEKEIKFLEKYRWSSFLDYIGKKNFPSVTQREFLLDFFDKENGYKKEFYKWLKEMDLSAIETVKIE